MTNDDYEQGTYAFFDFEPGILAFLLVLIFFKEAGAREERVTLHSNILI